jgi:hypothetical protein
MGTHLDVGRVGLQVVGTGGGPRFHNGSTAGRADGRKSGGKDERVGDGAGSVGVVEGVDTGNGEVERVYRESWWGEEGRGMNCEVGGEG